MADVDTTFLSELTPGFSVKPLMISVDRVALRETTITEGDPPFSFRELQSVDLYCWDEEGSRVVCSLVTPTAIDVYGQIILPRRKYYVSRYLVAEPGYGIHQSFHLRFDELTGVELSEDPFVDRVYNLRIPAEIPTCLTYLGTLYDVCGYVKNASQVGVRRLEGYAEKQFMISLESRIKTDVTDVKTMVTIYLRGAWTEAVCAKIRKLLMSSDAMPFILLKHLKLGRPAFTGRAVLRSVGDATRVYFNPEIQEVVEKRAEMFSG